MIISLFPRPRYILRAASGSLSQKSNPRRQRQSSLVAQSKIRNLYDDDDNIFTEGNREKDDPLSDDDDD